MAVGSSGRPTILIVDDDEGLRDSLHLILDEEYHVVDAGDGVQALTMLGTRRIDLVLLDLLMSRADGFEVLERRSETQKMIPIVVLSGLNTAWTAATAARLGAVDYITKPFDEEILLSVVRGAITSAGKLRRLARVGPSHVLLVGVGLGIHASLTILLRPRCRVEHAGDVAAALAYTSVPGPDVLIIHSALLGDRAIETFRWMRQRWPRAHVLVVGGGRPPDDVYLDHTILLNDPVRVSSLVRHIGTHVSASIGEFPAYSARVSAAIDHLAAHYSVASVRRLGRTVGLDPHYLSAIFRTEIGLSPRDYINQLRIEAARWLLLETGEKLETVAAQIGLYDASHLSRLFLKYAGDRPGAYRRHHDRASTQQTVG